MKIQACQFHYVFTIFLNYYYSVHLYLNLSNCLEKSLQFFWQNISDLAFYCLLPWAKRKWLALGHSAGFVPKVGLQLTHSQLLGCCLNHHTKLALFIILFYPDLRVIQYLFQHFGLSWGKVSTPLSQEGQSFLSKRILCLEQTSVLVLMERQRNGARTLCWEGRVFFIH